MPRVDRDIAALGVDTAVLQISLEGGVAAIPALARPRRIELANCSAEQRRRLRRVIDAAAARRDAHSVAGRGDARFFWVQIWRAASDTPPDRVLKIPETEATEALVALWRDGPSHD